MAVFTPELGATPLIHPSRVRLDSPSYSLTISRLETGDTGTWYCRVDGRTDQVTAYKVRVTGKTIDFRNKLERSFNGRVQSKKGKSVENTTTLLHIVLSVL